MAVVNSKSRQRPRSVASKGAGRSLALLDRTYERFLEVPVPIVLVVMWLAGAALIGVFVLALYLAWSLL